MGPHIWAICRRKGLKNGALNEATLGVVRVLALSAALELLLVIRIIERTATKVELNPHLYVIVVPLLNDYNNATVLSIETSITMGFVGKNQSDGAWKICPCSSNPSECGVPFAPPLGSVFFFPCVASA